MTDKMKRLASDMQDAATMLYEELEECESKTDVEEKGFEISGAVEEIERCLLQIKIELEEAE